MLLVEDGAVHLDVGDVPCNEVRFGARDSDSHVYVSNLHGLSKFEEEPDKLMTPIHSCIVFNICLPYFVDTPIVHIVPIGEVFGGLNHFHGLCEFLFKRGFVFRGEVDVSTLGNILLSLDAFLIQRLHQTTEILFGAVLKLGHVLLTGKVKDFKDEFETFILKEK